MLQLLCVLVWCFAASKASPHMVWARKKEKWDCKRAVVNYSDMQHTLHVPTPMLKLLNSCLPCEPNYYLYGCPISNCIIYGYFIPRTATPFHGTWILPNQMLYEPNACAHPCIARCVPQVTNGHCMKSSGLKPQQTRPKLFQFTVNDFLLNYGLI